MTSSSSTPASRIFSKDKDALSPPLMAGPPPPTLTGGLTPYQEQDYDHGRSYTACFQHISTMSRFQAYSPEELHLNDYKSGRGVTVIKSPKPALTNSIQPVNPLKPQEGSGLVIASLPFDNRLPQPDTRRAPNKSISTFRSGIVTIAVGLPGGRAEEFVIQRDLITRRSAFVREALGNEWKEARTGIISLPEDEPDIFALYHAWLYTGYILSKNESGGDGKTAEEYEELLKCYILGEKLLDNHFKDCTIDCFLAIFRATGKFIPSLSRLVFDNTPSRSPLRKLWLDIHILCGSPGWLKDSEEYPQDFLLEMSRRSMRGHSLNKSSGQGGRQEPGAHTIFESCRYHEHEDGICYRSVALFEKNTLVNAL